MLGNKFSEMIAILLLFLLLPFLRCSNSISLSVALRNNPSTIYKEHRATIDLFSEKAKKYHIHRQAVDKCYRELYGILDFFSATLSNDEEARQFVEQRCDSLDKIRQEMIFEIYQLLAGNRLAVFRYYELMLQSTERKLRRAMNQSRWSEMAKLYDLFDLIERDKKLILTSFSECRQDHSWGASSVARSSLS